MSGVFVQDFEASGPIWRIVADDVANVTVHQLRGKSRSPATELLDLKRVLSQEP